MMLDRRAKLRRTSFTREYENGEVITSSRITSHSNDVIGMQLEFRNKPNHEKSQDYAVAQPTVDYPFEDTEEALKFVKETLIL